MRIFLLQKEKKQAVGVNCKNVELHKFNSSPDINRIIKSRKVNLISNIRKKFLLEESVSEHQENLGEVLKLGIRF
jgi:hypothetical protein